MDAEDARTHLSRRALLGVAGSALALGALPGAARAQSPANPGPGLPATEADFALALSSLTPQITGSTGSVALGAVANFPVVGGQGASFGLMRIDPNGGLREPHWHPDSWELQYYLAGSGRVEIVLVSGESAQIPVSAGDLVFLPQGCGHAIVNTGSDELQALLVFQVDTPRSIGLGNFFSGMDTGVTTQTLGVPTSTLAAAPKPARGNPFPARQAGGLGAGPSLPATSQQLSYALAAATPQVDMPGGTITHVTADDLPAMKGAKAAMVLVRLQPGALREPHWHPNAWEINLCVAGSGEIGIVLPDGTQAAYAVTSGDAVFVPQGYAHYIANTGTSDMAFVSSFNADVPTTIGLAGFYGGISTRVAAQTLRVAPSVLQPIPRPTSDPAIAPPLG
jgi:oxalate decarboxylase